MYVDNNQLVFSGLFSIGKLEQLDWRPFRAGIEIFTLYDNGPEGASAALLKYEAGATVPEHRHLGAEHIIVLAGAQNDDNDEYSAGTLVINYEGSQHSVMSRQGCIVLVIWTKQVSFVE